MTQLFDLILSNPLYTIIAIVLVAALIFAIIKKVIKLIIVLIVILIAYLAYIDYTGDDVQQALDKVIDEGTETAKDAKKTVEENKQLQDAKKKIEKEMKK